MMVCLPRLSWHKDITEQKEAEEQIALYVKQLEDTMYGTLQAVSTMVEMRDPYTAGHEASGRINCQRHCQRNGVE